MLLKNPESATSMPLMSRVHVLIRSFETMPNSFGDRKHSRNLCRKASMTIRAVQAIALPCDGFNQRGFAAAVLDPESPRARRPGCVT